MSINKRVRIYTLEDVENHKTSSSCWVTRGGKVYDVTAFLPDHPGGDDFILKYAGQDIEKVMNDSEEHEHSDSAYDMMGEYLVGRLGNQANIVDESEAALSYVRCSYVDTLVQIGKHRTTSTPKIQIRQMISRSTNSSISRSLC